MLPKPPSGSGNSDLFRSELDQILDPDHELVRLGKLIDWKALEVHFGRLYIDKKGRPGLPTRLMVGLHLLQHPKGLSDEAVCAAWLENPYMQKFCGATFFQHKLPLDRSSMSRWRKRAGTADLEKILAETLAAAQRAKAVEPKAFERITVDSTAQTGGTVCKSLTYTSQGREASRRQPSKANLDAAAPSSPLSGT